MKRMLAALLTAALLCLCAVPGFAATAVQKENGGWSIEQLNLYPEVFDGFINWNDVTKDSATEARFAALLVRETASALSKADFDPDAILEIYLACSSTMPLTVVFFSNSEVWLWPIGSSSVSISVFNGNYSTTSARSSAMSNSKDYGIYTDYKKLDMTAFQEAMAWDPPTTAGMLAAGDYEGLFRSAGSVSSQSCGWFRFQKNFVGGYVNTKGEFLLNNWNYVTGFNEKCGLASVYRGEVSSGSYSYPKTDDDHHALGQYGVIDTEGNTVFDLIYDSVDITDDLVRLRTLDNHYLLYNAQTREPIDVSAYDWASSSVSDGLIQVFRGTLGSYHSPDTGLYGYIDPEGREVFPPMFESCSSVWYDGLTWVKQNGKTGLIDKTGSFVVPCTWDSIDSISNGTAIAKRKDLAYLIDTGTGAILYSFNTKNAYKEGDGYYTFCDTFKNDMGLLDASFNTVLPREWSAVDMAGKDSTLFVVGKKPDPEVYTSVYGVMDMATGEMKLPMIYDSISLTAYEGLRSYKQNGYYGYMNEQFQIMIPASYDSTTSFSGGCAAVRENGTWCLIDQYGITLY